MAALKILIVEDNGIASDILTQALQSDQQLQVVGVARNGQEALEMLPRLSPDLITLDVWMPVMDGFETVERIMAEHPTPILVITSSSLKKDVQISMRMLAAGALDVIEKPYLTDETQWQRYQHNLTARVKLLAGVKVITHLRGRRSLASAANSSPRSNLPNSSSNYSMVASKLAPLPRPPEKATPIKAFFPTAPFYQVVALASSTGGPTALLRILQTLPANLPCGILIVQHISEGFTQGLVDWLQRETPLKLKMAQPSDRLTRGMALIAPDGCDMQIGPEGQILISKDSSNLLRPSADLLLSSVARNFGSHAIGAVLTGMGNDGARGLLTMYREGAYTIAQDEATSLIYGMPRACAENGAAREILALERIAARLVYLLQQPNGGSANV